MSGVPDASVDFFFTPCRATQASLLLLSDRARGQGGLLLDPPTLPAWSTSFSLRVRYVPGLATLSLSSGVPRPIFAYLLNVCELVVLLRCRCFLSTPVLYTDLPPYRLVLFAADLVLTVAPDGACADVFALAPLAATLSRLLSTQDGASN